MYLLTSARSCSSIDQPFRVFARFIDSHCFSDLDLTDLVIQWNPDFSNLQGKRELVSVKNRIVREIGGKMAV